MLKIIFQLSNLCKTNWRLFIFVNVTKPIAFCHLSYGGTTLNCALYIFFAFAFVWEILFKKQNNKNQWPLQSMISFVIVLFIICVVRIFLDVILSTVTMSLEHPGMCEDLSTHLFDHFVIPLLPWFIFLSCMLITS